MRINDDGTGLWFDGPEYAEWEHAGVKVRISPQKGAVVVTVTVPIQGVSFYAEDINALFAWAAGLSKVASGEPCK